MTTTITGTLVGQQCSCNGSLNCPHCKTVTSTSYYPYNITTQWPTVNISQPRRYYTFELPHKSKVPTHVFVNGKLLTFGIVGTDVECAFAGSHLIFDADVFGFTVKTLIVEYKEEMFHYNINPDMGKAKLNCTLMSTTQK
jgi:hypothetical protein